MSQVTKAALEDAFRKLASFYTRKDERHIDWVTKESCWSTREVAFTTASASKNPPAETGAKQAAALLISYLTGEEISENEYPEAVEILEGLDDLKGKDAYKEASAFVQKLRAGNYPQLGLALASS